MFVRLLTLLVVVFSVVNGLDCTNTTSFADTNSTNATIIIKGSGIDDAIIISPEDELVTKKSNGFQNNSNFLKRVFFDKFDRHTLIMIVAFIIGLVLISGIIAISICVCNGVETCSSMTQKSAHLPSSDLATNPAYDNVKTNYESDDNNNSKIDMTMQQPNSEIPLIPTNNNNQSLLNTTSSMSCSTASINSVVFVKTPGSIEFIAAKSPQQKLNPKSSQQNTTPVMPGKVGGSNIRSSLSNIVNSFSSTPSKIKKQPEEKSSSENERSLLLDETDNNNSTEVEAASNDSSVTNRKPMFTTQPKTGQQILREQKISKHPSYLRTHSEAANRDSMEAGRLSAGSSRNSIAMPAIPLNFDQIKDDIDDLAINKEKLASRTNLDDQSRSQANSQNYLDKENGSTNTSIADIYTKEFINKHQQSTQKSSASHPKKLVKTETSASVSSILSEGRREQLKLKRLSMNVDISKINLEQNPNSQSTTNLDRTTSVSNYTIGSEKSCY